MLCFESVSGREGDLISAIRFGGTSLNSMRPSGPALAFAPACTRLNKERKLL